MPIQLSHLNRLVPVSIPEHPPKSLAEGVLHSLSRPLGGALAWGALRTVLLGVLSGGIAPLLWLAKRRRDFWRVERVQLWHLAEWLRLTTASPQADSMRALAGALRGSRVTGFLIVAFAGFAAACLVAFVSVQGADLSSLLVFTAMPLRAPAKFAAQPQLAMYSRLYSIAMAAGFVASIVEMADRARNVRSCV
ncbi:MAG: hypothetical protein ACREJC_15105, partial [Tepidisphaeraceae bacterium]